MLADFSDKDVVAQFIASNKSLTEYNKALTAQLLTHATTIPSLIQHGTVTTGQTIQEKAEVTRKKYESNWIQEDIAVPTTQGHPHPH